MNQSLQARWARRIIKALRKRGIREFFVSPGARSAPLSLALAEARELGEAEVFFHYDERGLAFAALGFSQAQARPVVCVTTSGSAVANLLPACVEGFQSGVPLIFLTADRPPELRDTGANQTIFQPGIFGNHVLAAVDMPPPCESLLPALEIWILDTLQALEDGWGGPIHFNIPFREPLLPENPAYQPPKISPDSPQQIWQESETKALTFLEASWFEQRQKGIIVVGELTLAEQASWDKILALAGHLAWPIVADALSGGKGLPHVINHADFVLQRETGLIPDGVLQLGGRVVQRRLQDFLARFPGDDLLQVRRGPRHLRAPGQNPKFVQGHPGEFCAAAFAALPAAWSDAWRMEWEQHDTALEEELAQLLSSEEELLNLSEPGLARWVAHFASHKEALLFLGNSMPVRDFDAMVGKLPQRLRVFGQRGASGIDGNIAHVAGVALACKEPVYALLGDLAVLHDLNSLAMLRSLPVTLIVPNNHGGGIFEFLPMDISPNVRQEFLETPHHLHFSEVCSQFAIPYAHTNSAVVAEAFLNNRSGGPAFIEVPSDRKTNFEKHRSISKTLLC